MTSSLCRLIKPQGLRLTVFFFAFQTTTNVTMMMIPEPNHIIASLFIIATVRQQTRKRHEGHIFPSGHLWNCSVKSLCSQKHSIDCNDKKDARGHLELQTRLFVTLSECLIHQGFTVYLYNC